VVDGGGDDRVVEHVEVDVGAAAPYEQRDVGSVVAGELVERTGDAQRGVAAGHRHAVLDDRQVAFGQDSSPPSLNSMNRLLDPPQ
jgi:hypothetical protein